MSLQSKYSIVEQNLKSVPIFMFYHVSESVIKTASKQAKEGRKLNKKGQEEIGFKGMHFS